MFFAAESLEKAPIEASGTDGGWSDYGDGQGGDFDDEAWEKENNLEEQVALELSGGDVLEESNSMQSVESNVLTVSEAKGGQGSGRVVASGIIGETSFEEAMKKAALGKNIRLLSPTRMF